MQKQAQSHRIPALDGLRGIAILMVLEDHFINSRHPAVGNWGLLGVTIFFVLSGYLITRNLLLKDKIDLRQFYLRRIKRLWPSAWAYLFFVFFAAFLGTRRVEWGEIAKCVFFVRNYFHGVWTTEHFWTLSIEEQFYLVWPAILLFAGRKWSAWIAATGIAAVGVYRALNWAVWTDAVHFRHSWATQYRADALLVGCLFAILALRYPDLLSRSKTLLLSGLGCVVLTLIPTRISPTAELFAIILLLRYSLDTNPLASALSFRPLVWMGRISYSLYLWQEFYFAIGWRSAHLWLWIIPALFTAAAAYYLIEKPTMQSHAPVGGEVALQVV